MALPKLQFKELKRRLVEIKQPLNIHSNVSFILVMIGGLIQCPIIAYVLWRIYRVHSNIKGFKPVVKIFNDKKGDIFNISDLVSNRLQNLEAKFSSLIGPGTTNIFTGTELTLPHTSTKPTPPPRSDSVPMLDINITPQTIQETVRDMEKQGPKLKDSRSTYRNKIPEVPTGTNLRRPRVIRVKNFTRTIIQIETIHRSNYL